MARYLHSIARTLVDFPAASQLAVIDLPVNPLSLILLRFQMTNVAPAAIGTFSAVDDLITNITSIIVKHKGENIISGQLRDLMALNALFMKLFPNWSFIVNTDDAVRDAVFPLCFGRRPYDPKECFPATSRGNLTLEITRAANPAGFDDLNVSVETVELIEADPERYLKYTPQTATAVVGQFDVSLPIANPYVGLLFFDTGLATLATGVSSWGQIKLLKDNVEQYFPLSDAQLLAGMNGVLARCAPDGWPGHIHQINDGAALSDSDDAEILASHGYRGLFGMHFDPLGDGTYLLETEGAADIKLRANGTSATAVRVTPVELVTVRK